MNTQTNHEAIEVLRWNRASSEEYHEALGAVPPLCPSQDGFLLGEPVDHHGPEGTPRYWAFICLRNEHMKSSHPVTVEKFKSLWKEPFVLRERRTEYPSVCAREKLFNEVLLKLRFEQLNQTSGPRLGDWVHTDQGYTRITHDWDTHLQTGLGSFYLGGQGHVSYSGSLNPGIPKEKFVDTGATRLGSVWFFSNDEAKAHNGVDCMMPFRVFCLTA